MTERLLTRLAAAGVVVAALLPVAESRAETAPPGRTGQVAAAPKNVTVGYVELADDPRYAGRGAYGNFYPRTVSRPFKGSQVALAEAQQTGRFLGIGFSSEKITGTSVDALAAKVKDWAAAGTHFVVADLPAPALVALADAVKDVPAVLINVSAPDDMLRAEACRANVLHVYPSQAMLEDALGQYLAARKWRDVLVLQGPSPQDAATAAAFQRSARKFGLQVVAIRPFTLSNDPRDREESNVALMTEGIGYDVVFVADSSNEVGRYIPYATSLPRPVVGDAGLVPTAWSWTWDRDAAGQLQHRFEQAAMPERMNGANWAAWAAVKAVTEAAIRTNSVDFATMRGWLLSGTTTLDTVKGSPGSFRAWDHQFRQPLLLVAGDAVIQSLPLPEFLHQTNVLDTLGVDEPESRCRL